MPHHRTLASQIHHIRLAELEARFPSFTREAAISLALSVRLEGRTAVDLVVIDDHDWERQPIELASVFVALSEDGEGHLRYVSHAEQCRGVTSKVQPTEGDLMAFVEVCRELGTLPKLSIHCTEEIEAEGLGPLALLDLRSFSGIAQVPTSTDVVALCELAIPQLFKSGRSDPASTGGRWKSLQG